MLSEDAKQKISKLHVKYATRKSACMVAMQIVQREVGQLTEQDMCEIADLLGIKPIEVDEVGGFYSMYNVEKTVGKYHIEVCRNLSCALLEAEAIIAFIETRLGIKTGQTTADNKFTLSTAECLGSCGTAPMMQINDDYYESLTEARVAEIIDGLK